MRALELAEIKTQDLEPSRFISQKVNEISDIVGNGIAINALSGGVDSSVVTLLGHLALGERLKTYFINNGLMREGEPESIKGIFNGLGVNVELVDAKTEFFDALKGVVDPEEKREAITQTFYMKVFGELVRQSRARHLLQGTIYTDVEETAAGIKRQHNVFEQIGIDPEEAFGYKIIEPLKELRKGAVRLVGRELGLPEGIYNRMPFPGPALAARVIGEATPELVEIVRRATKIVEEELSQINAFQYMAILHKDLVTGKRNGDRAFGMQIEIRCWNSIDATTATPTELPYSLLLGMSKKITNTIHQAVSVTYNITSKPPSTIEAV